MRLRTRARLGGAGGGGEEEGELSILGQGHFDLEEKGSRRGRTRVNKGRVGHLICSFSVVFKSPPKHLDF